MDSADLLGVAIVVGSVLFVVGAVAFGWYFAEDQKIRRRIRSAPRVKIAEARDGMEVRLVGTIRPGHTLSSPLSHRLGVYYRATIEEYRSSGKSGSWYLIADEEQFVDFSLADETGEVLVRMVHPRVSVVNDTHSRSGTFDDATPAEESFLQRHGGCSLGLFGLNRTLRYKEGVFEPGEQVSVVGRIVAMDGLKVVEPLPEHGLFASDDPGIV